MFLLSQASKKNRAGIHHDLILLSDEAILTTPIDFGHGQYSGLRTGEQQFELFSAGKSKCDGINNRSPHQDGRALDFQAYAGNVPTWERKYYAMLMAHVAATASRLGIRIRLGIMFRPLITDDGVPYGWDAPHIELLD